MQAPGAPGMEARWTSSAKSGVGTALTANSRIWFTISHGILNEIYFPRVDTACTRDFGLIVTDGRDYFSEEKRHTAHEVAMVEEGVPGFRLTNTALDGRYRMSKQIITDPLRDTVLQEVRFEPLHGTLLDYRLYALIAPHLVNGGAGNTAWLDDYKGTPMLFAQGRFGVSLAVACSVPWANRSVGYVGTSDGWQQLSQHKHLAECYSEAPNGNVAMTGEIDLPATGGAPFLLALSIAARPQEAAYRALATLQGGFDAALKGYVSGWRKWQESLLPLDRAQPARKKSLNAYRVSTSVLAVHSPVSFPGAVIASLSIPWGTDKGDEDLGGYHLVWPRDLVETAGGFLAAGAVNEAMAVLRYLNAVQEADGHWSQNMWLDGEPYWHGVQMDECAFPILLMDMLRREGHLSEDEVERLTPMVQKATGYLVRNGPVTGQDRWEEDAGYSPFTLAVEIAGLLAAADILEMAGHMRDAQYARDTADVWNDQIERWTFATDTPICEKLGLSGYYVRIAPPDTCEAASPLQGYVPIKNRPPESTNQPANLILSPDALALVRFGLRAADDPRILDTVKAIDDMLKIELPQGPVWYRYNGDGYGEKADGSSFDGTGIGRAWPLLTGERAHYELAAGRTKEAQRLLNTLERSSNEGGLIPEQVWDQDDIPERGLFRGKPSGSAMPLVWAHGEHIKLLRSLHDGRVFDMPPQPVERYQHRKVTAPFRAWRFNNRLRSIPQGKALRIELMEPALVHWSMDGWSTAHDATTEEAAFGIYVADLPTGAAPPETRILFTLKWLQQERWQGEDFVVVVT
ncbi:glucan 1,4-alpha-glucosidase [Rhodoligotrophos defluvii]|uniref:glucan 1,4-alpha-glucosidase n=1 Tax=Rhodoligotrophos defluvii TaxID=2561934 RepID=UPI0010C988E0|nr:glucan 1,4-alpha-glucosidase [Rhodoligotrophos defluvii]